MPLTPPKQKARPKPFLLPEYCKGCGRCIQACPKHCIEFEQEVNSASGFLPVKMNLENCNGCGLCIASCPEPYGLHPDTESFYWEAKDPAAEFGPKATPAPVPVDIPGQRLPLAPMQPLLTKGNYASAIGAILAGCRHVYGYPITPSTEGAELMARILPRLDGIFLQAVSEVATINHMYGCGGAGLPCMTFTSSPGLSLMLEGVSYMIGAEIPGVIVNVMRGGPGLGNIAPEQSDIKLCCRGLGHGNTHALALAPSNPQEMLDLTMLAFELTFKYRQPVLILADGYLGQMTGKVCLPEFMLVPGIPKWAVYGDEMHRGNLMSSIHLAEKDLEKFNQYLNAKYQSIIDNEQRADCYRCEDAEVLIVAANTPARMAKGAIQILRDSGIRAGLFRPITLWPFPVKHLLPLLPNVRRLVVAEASHGQLEDEMRLALSHAGVTALPPIDRVQRFGGILPSASEIVEIVTQTARGKQ